MRSAREALVGLACLMVVSAPVGAQESSCDALFQRELVGWLGTAATGAEGAIDDVLSTFLASLDDVDLDFDDTKVKLAWNPKKVPYFSFETKIATQSSLYGPLAEQLEADSELLKKLQGAAETAEDVTLTVRYHREASKEKKLNRGEEVKRLPFGTVALAEAASSKSADGDDSKAVTAVKHSIWNVLKKSFEGDIPTAITNSFGPDESGLCELLALVLDKELPELGRSQSINEAVESVLGSASASSVRESTQGVPSKGRLAENVSDGELPPAKLIAPRNRESDGQPIESAGADEPVGAFAGLIQRLAAATTNTPEFLVEVSHSERHELVGAVETRAKMQYNLPIAGARKYLDEPGSLLRFLRKSQTGDEAFARRAKLVFSAEYADIDDYLFDQGVETPITLAGGYNWSASFGYTREFRRSFMREANPPEGATDKRMRFDLLAEYEDWETNPMRPNDRLLAQGLFTIPARIGGQEVEVTVGLVWANKSEFLKELDFDSEVSARAGLVLKWGESRLRDLLE